MSFKQGIERLASFRLRCTEDQCSVCLLDARRFLDVGNKLSDSVGYNMLCYYSKLPKINLCEDVDVGCIDSARYLYGIAAKHQTYVLGFSIGNRNRLNDFYFAIEGQEGLTSSLHSYVVWPSNQLVHNMHALSRHKTKFAINVVNVTHSFNNYVLLNRGETFEEAMVKCDMYA